MMRLERFVAAHLNTQRDASKPPPNKGRARALIAAGAVRVNGREVIVPGFQVFLGNGVVCDQVEVEGTVVKVATADRLFVLHKPAGILGILNRQARNGGTGAANVSDLVPDRLWSNDLAMLGRLDKPTTGLCVLARQETLGVGALLLHPDHHVRKSYLVHLAHNTPMRFGGGHGLVPSASRQFEDGVLLVDGTRCKPGTLTILPEPLGCCVCADRLAAYQASRPCDPSGHEPPAPNIIAASGGDGRSFDPGGGLDPSSDAASAPPGGDDREHADHRGLPVLHTVDGGCAAYTTVRVTITEGKYHQVKRMLAMVGGDGVHRLHRETFGTLSLDRMDLPLGEMRPMRDEEYRMVHAMLPACRTCPVRPRSDNYGRRKPGITHSFG